MASASTFLETMLLNLTLRGVACVVPSSILVALYTTDPTNANIGTEVSGGGYRRQIITFGLPEQKEDKMQCVNIVEVNFPVATADWGLITHIGICDAFNAGNLLYYGALSVPKEIKSGDRFRFLDNSVKVSIT